MPIYPDKNACQNNMVYSKHLLINTGQWGNGGGRKCVTEVQTQAVNAVQENDKLVKLETRCF